MTCGQQRLEVRVRARSGSPGGSGLVDLAELFVRLGTALAAAGGGVEAQRGPAVARRPPRGCVAQVHQQALVLSDFSLAAR